MVTTRRGGLAAPSRPALSSPPEVIVRRLFALFLVALAGGALVAGLGLWLALARGGQPALAGGKLLLTYRIDGDLLDRAARRGDFRGDEPIGGRAA